MQLAANFTLREQALCPRGFISGGTQQVGMEKATGSLCSNPKRLKQLLECSASNQGCTAAAGG